MTTVVEIANLSKHFTIRKEKSLKERVVNFGRSRAHKEDFWALRDIDVSIEAGTTVGLIGPNGSGKSTLLKMIGGILQPDTGSVSIRGRLAALLELGAGFHPDLTGRENVYLNASILGISREQTDKYFDAIVDFSGIEKFIDTQVKFYSSGMYVRLAFAVAVHVDPDILLVDEVLAVGDEPFQRKCLERIRQFQAEGRTIILVTHGLDQVDEFCDRAVVLENGRVVTDGTAREALRTLRADFEDARQEERSRQQAAPDARKELDAHFTGIALRSDSGAIGQPTLAQGEGLLVAMEIDSPVPVARPIIEIGIATPLGMSVYSTNTTLLGVEPGTLRPTSKFQVHLGGMRLGEGDYSIQVGLTLDDGTEVHRVPDAAQFSVTGPGTSAGFVGADAEFEVLS
ncbi:ABC transporter ATP-binding protein [Xylanimonas ulmi]|uniref:ABC-2 type transport system ATP-binding protein n=1 Tax=Xylanimonas ulmi TaxID=228973 RepID=A0A4Q7LZT4_9MICO|nr:ABC transporter ATP-binding protein [Xylanibacterium ulmi]RZS59947.1 ABC-2 type transport system ATP-binding protein [Xylanibacterium ulmi]